MGNPSKPSSVDVDKLKTVLTTLQQMQHKLKVGTPGSWDSIGNGDEVAKDLKGMQENVAQMTGQYYGDVTYYVNQNWNTIKSGVDTLVQLVQGTINAHSGNDDSTAQNAQNVNTGQTATPAGKD
jgi:hypothetical protein